MDLEISPSKIGATAQRIIDQAVEEAERRKHTLLENEHLLIALIQLEWDLFAQLMRDFGLNPQTVLKAIEEHLCGLPSFLGSEFNISASLKLVLQLALHRANRAGRPTIETYDLFSSLLNENHCALALIIRNHGIEPGKLISGLDKIIKNRELLEEQLRRRFELPPFLKHFATNLNFLARQNKIHPVYGRDSEIRQILEILCHRERTNSVMLIGESGVGKTAIVEGLARKIEYEPETIPARLRNCMIVNLQMGTLVAGTMLRGMFEDRITNVIREIKERPNLILFVDEAHTIIGAGSALGAPMDAGNILKSALSRGEVRMIAATTFSEWGEHIQEDEALARRFRTVMIPEPTIQETRHILYSLRPHLENNYSVKISDEALETALELSPRYMRHLHLPDKTISWLDTASVRAEIGQKLEINSEDVISVIADNTRIPQDMIKRSVEDRFKDLGIILHKRVIGQNNAIDAIVRRLILNKGLLKENFDKPDGVLLFLGPTGVGKTELAKAIAEFLFGDDKKMIRLDMSEYQNEIFGIGKLIGMPRGIAGSERGGTLTNQLRDNPYSVILLDEVEKASKDTLNLFLQAFDEGWITDGRGKRVYLSEAIIIMTSNLGSRHFRRLTSPLGFASQNNIGINLIMKEIKKEIKTEMERTFSPEFINRIDEVVVFSPLVKEEVRRIAEKYIESIGSALLKERKYLEVDDDVFDKLATEGHSLAFGARFLKRLIDEQIKIPISARLQSSNSFHVVLQSGKIEVETKELELQTT